MRGWMEVQRVKPYGIKYHYNGDALENVMVFPDKNMDVDYSLTS